MRFHDSFRYRFNFIVVLVASVWAIFATQIVSDEEEDQVELLALAALRE